MIYQKELTSETTFKRVNIEAGWLNHTAAKQGNLL